MYDFVSGQRWISSSELQMGLGTILSVEHRTVSILFMATGETRLYAKESAPLTRVIFAPGDHVATHEGWSLIVQSVTEEAGLLSYHGFREDHSAELISIEEGQLDNFIQLNSPSERFFSGQIDRNKWFELRYQSQLYHCQRGQSPLHGLCGGRTSLIAHQLYIAHEVANRYAPRVLLADEVGLGKTIEAGMILHQQLLSERARRVLIVVPETLMYQWLVEMLRRFNLHFSIFDDDRWLAMQEDREAEGNPFQSEQLVLCSLEFLVKDSDRFQQAHDGEWDLLVVDEAHHLLWTPDEVSIEYAYIARLSKVTRGVLLLTATPEQLGKAGHFARLRLLDPDRFPSLEHFIKEEQSFAPIARLIEELLQLEKCLDTSLSELSQTLLTVTLSAEENRQWQDAAQNPDVKVRQHGRDELISHLLDRHGTGRILFRNTRNTIKGFPQRKLFVHPLTASDSYLRLIRPRVLENHVLDLQQYLSPELAYVATNTHTNRRWTDLDPRVDWLITMLQAQRDEKILVITASAASALDLTEALRTSAGIHAAVFHEGLSILDRDRAAAFFADKEYGSQVLICSEIGSEGRNFQFSHQLVLFDLPLNPDLLEQRIGRLDRIGQTQMIQVHVPYIEGTAQAVLFQWYHQGLSAFESTCPAGHNVFVEIEQELIAVIVAGESPTPALSALLKRSQQLHDDYNQALQQGRDRLLEYNSCRPHQAERLKFLAQQADEKDALQLVEYMGLLFDSLGIESEEHSALCQVIRPGDHMQISSLPGLPEDGLTITYDRATALANEDIQFVNWEHPFTLAAMDSVLSSEFGNTAMITCKYAGVKSGSLLLECIYKLEPVGNTPALSERHLPASVIRIVIDQEGRDHEKMLLHENIAPVGAALNRETQQKILRARRDILRGMLDSSEKLATDRSVQMLQDIQKNIGGRLLEEKKRLQALQKINPNIRAEEIEYFADQQRLLDIALNVARPRLDALRAIIVV